MIAYAPAAAPKYAVAVLVEDAPHGGGADAGPIVKKILLDLFPAYAAPDAGDSADAEVP